MRWALLSFLLLFGVAGQAVAAPLTRAEEARAVAIASQLRCLVCQNESVEESSASLAVDLRRVIREQVAEGRTNAEIMRWMTARYGDFIRLKPPFEPLTLLLWGIPILAPLAGLGIAFTAYRYRNPPPRPLTADEKSQLSELLE